VESPHLAPALILNTRLLRTLVLAAAAGVLLVLLELALVLVLELVLSVV
jgi:hypothetical protein